MKSFLSILILWLSVLMLPAQANMAAPQQTTPAYHPFISKHVDILHETIQIFPAPDLRHSKMVIEYHIQSEESKEQVPLLFYAYNIKDDFQIEIDGTSIPTQQAPEEYNALDGMVVDHFDFLFSGIPKNELQKTTKIEGYRIALKDLHFFTVNLEAGKHIIKAEYEVVHAEHTADLLHSYNLSYILSPANQWKSFDSLDIMLEMPDVDASFYTDIGDGTSTDTPNQHTWHLNNLNNTTLEITFTPTLPVLALPFTFHGYLLYSFIFWIAYLVAHVIILRKLRVDTNQKRWYGALFIGIAVLPLLKPALYFALFFLLSPLLPNAEVAFMKDLAPTIHANIMERSDLELVLSPYILLVYFIVLITVYLLCSAIGSLKTKGA